MLHLSRRDFLEMRPKEFWSALRAHTEETNAERRHIGELVRGATLRLINIQLDPAHRMDSPAKFWEMPWDDVPERSDGELEKLKEMTDAEKSASAKRLLQRFGWIDEDGIEEKSQNMDNGG